MKVECFIPDWPGLKQNAGAIANMTARLCPTTILDDPRDYFNAQWEKARKKFTGDVLLWVMADVLLPDNFPQMYQDMIKIMSRGDVGWYAPNVDWTAFIYDKNTLKELENDIYEVPNTDSLCFAIRGDIVREMPYIDHELCFMWGMDFTAVATANLMGYKIVRDYKYKVLHPNDTGYDIDKASYGMKCLFESYSEKLRNEINKFITIANKLKIKSCL